MKMQSTNAIDIIDTVDNFTKSEMMAIHGGAEYCVIEDDPENGPPRPRHWASDRGGHGVGSSFVIMAS